MRVPGPTRRSARPETKKAGREGLPFSSRIFSSASAAEAATHRDPAAVVPARGHDCAAAGVVSAPVMAVTPAVALADIDAARAGADDDALSLRRTARSERANSSGRGNRGSEKDPFHVLPPDLHEWTRTRTRRSGTSFRWHIAKISHPYDRTTLRLAICVTSVAGLTAGRSRSTLTRLFPPAPSKAEAMHNTQNRQDTRPSGIPQADNFAIRRVPVPDLRKGQFLVRNDVLSDEPAKHSKNSAGANYATPVGI